MSKCVGAIFISIAVFATRSAAHAQSVEQVMKVHTRISSDLVVDAIYPCETPPRTRAAARGVVALTGATKGLRWVEAFTRASETLPCRIRIVARQPLKASAPGFARRFRKRINGSGPNGLGRHPHACTLISPPLPPMFNTPMLS